LSVFFTTLFIALAWAFSQFADVTGAANDHVHYTCPVTVPTVGMSAVIAARAGGAV
jgi:hypothetical protein